MGGISRKTIEASTTSRLTVKADALVILRAKANIVTARSSPDLVVTVGNTRVGSAIGSRA